MSRIIIEADKLKDPYSGLGNFTSCLINELLKIDSNQLIDWRVYSSSPRAFSYIALEESHVHRLFPSMLPKGDLWHVLHQDSPYIPDTGKLVLTIQDMNYFYKDKPFLLKKKYELTLKKKIERADGLTFISEFAKKETEKYFDISKKRLRVIHNGVEEPKNLVAPNFSVKKPFLFTISKLLPKKNIKVLFDFVNLLGEEVLYIAGGLNTEYAKELQKIVKDKNLGHKVYFMGNLDSDIKFWMMKNCRAFVFPSLFEGFGLPPLEAMRFGKPVFVSKATSLPEVCGNAAYYWDSFRPEDMVYSYKKALEIHDEERERQVIEHRNQYSWKKAAENYFQFYQEILNIN